MGDLMEAHVGELIGVLGIVFTLLIAVLAWIGNRVHTKLDDLTKTVDMRFMQLHESLGNIDRDLRADLSNHGERIAKLETSCRINHAKD